VSLDAEFLEPFSHYPKVCQGHNFVRAVPEFCRLDQAVEHHLGSAQVQVSNDVENPHLEFPVGAQSAGFRHTVTHLTNVRIN
jgi:hypothetical protein